MLFIILLCVYILLVLLIIGILLLSATHPTKTLAWVLVILVLPLGGILLYIMMGINRRKYKFNKLQKTKAVNDYLKKAKNFYDKMDEGANNNIDIENHLKLAKIVIKNSRTLPHSGNKINILQDGKETFDSIFEAMENAAHFIHIQYYIYEEGTLTDRFLEIMQRKSKEGIEVRLMYDGLGSFSLSRKYRQQLKDSNIDYHSFMPVRFGKITTGLNYRNHRKIVIVDGRVAFTGGINVSDKYMEAKDELGIWRDTHLRLEGPSVRALSVIFANDWYFVSEKKDLQQERYFPKIAPAGKSTAQIVYSGPDSDYPSILQQYFTIINQAEEYVYISNSYIIPGEALLQSLTTTALSGVDVRILLPDMSDSKLVRFTVRSYFDELLRAGVKIYLYKKRFLHCKVIIADDTVSSVGTANLDIRSFEQNFEVNALVYDPAIAKELKADFLADCKNSTLLDAKKHANRPRLEKLLEGAARIFSPLL